MIVILRYSNERAKLCSDEVDSIFIKYFNIKMKKLSGSFRNTQWDPVLLIFQILAMQTSGYFSLGLIMALMEGLAGSNHTLDHIFQYHVIKKS